MGYKHGGIVHCRLGGGKHERTGFFFVLQNIDTRIQQSLSRIKRASGNTGGSTGKIVGRYWLGQNGKYEFLAEKIEKDFRHGLEFICRVRPFYQMTELLKLDYMVFFQLLDECEAEQKEAITRAKERQ